MPENILQLFNIHVAHKPITTLRQSLTNVKDKDELKNNQCLWHNKPTRVVHVSFFFFFPVVRPSEFDEYVKYCGHNFPVIRLSQDEIGVGYSRY